MSHLTMRLATIRVWIALASLAGCLSEDGRLRSRDDAFALGNAHYDQGDFDAAIARYTESVDLDPSFSMGYNNRGLARAQKGDLDGAIADYDASIALPSRMAEAYYNRGVARHRKSQYPEAIQDFTEALALSPRYPRALAGRGLARGAMGERTGAVIDLKAALAMGPPQWTERKHLESELERLTRANEGK